MKKNDIYNYLERLSAYLRIDSRQSLINHGLQPIQLEVLHYLSVCNRFSDTPMAVTEYLGQTKGTVSQTIKLLEERGLLEKIDDKLDKRVAHLKLTDAGKSLLKETLPTPLFVKACDDLTDKEQEQITVAFDLLLKKIIQTNELKSFGVCKTCRYNSHSDKDGHFCNLVQVKLGIKDTQLICREHSLPEE
jgi:MarR family transcriptional regulator, organic hydroperoxide resistance regulator